MPILAFLFVSHIKEHYSLTNIICNRYVIIDTGLICMHFISLMFKYAGPIWQTNTTVTSSDIHEWKSYSAGFTIYTSEISLWGNITLFIISLYNAAEGKHCAYVTWLKQNVTHIVMLELSIWTFTSKYPVNLMLLVEQDQTSKIEIEILLFLSKIWPCQIYGTSFWIWPSILGMGIIRNLMVSN